MKKREGETSKPWANLTKKSQRPVNSSAWRTVQNCLIKEFHRRGHDFHTFTFSLATCCSNFISIEPSQKMISLQINPKSKSATRMLIVVICRSSCSSDQYLWFSSWTRLLHVFEQKYSHVDCHNENEMIYYLRWEALRQNAPFTSHETLQLLFLINLFSLGSTCRHHTTDFLNLWKYSMSEDKTTSLLELGKS